MPRTSERAASAGADEVHDDRVYDGGAHDHSVQHEA